MENIVSLSEKPLLTLKEATIYFNVGEHRLRRITDENQELVVWAGNKRLIKRRMLEVFLYNSLSI